MYRLSDWADEYERIARKQNRGGVCDHCGSALGHYGTCSLVNWGEPLVLDSIEQRQTIAAIEKAVDKKTVAIKQVYALADFSDEDRIMAHAFGVRL